MKSIVKNILFLIRDLLVLGVFFAALIASVWGVVLPYRSVFVSAGPYQLQAFETGLSFFHFGWDKTPFYNVSVFNDYIITSGGNRTPLLTGDVYDAKSFEYVNNPSQRHDLFKQTIYQYFDKVAPYYEFKTKDIKAIYSTRKAVDGWIIEKSLQFSNPLNIATSAITFSYNNKDIVFDGLSGQAYTPVDQKTTQLISTYFKLKVSPNEKLDTTKIQTSGSIIIINPERPGYLIVSTPSNQTLSIDRQYLVIEAVKNINAKVSSVEQVIFVAGKDAT